MALQVRHGASEKIAKLSLNIHSRADAEMEGRPPTGRSVASALSFHPECKAPALRESRRAPNVARAVASTANWRGVRSLPPISAWNISSTACDALCSKCTGDRSSLPLVFDAIVYLPCSELILGHTFRRSPTHPLVGISLHLFSNLPLPRAHNSRP